MALPRGEKATRMLQECYLQEQTACLESGDWRLVYAYIDAGTPGLLLDDGADDAAAALAAKKFTVRKFCPALFYFGKGTVKRAFQHLEEAKEYLLKASSGKKVGS